MRRSKSIILLAMMISMIMLLASCQWLERGIEIFNGFKDQLMGSQNQNSTMLESGRKPVPVTVKEAEEKINLVLDAWIDGEETDEVSVLTEDGEIIPLTGSEGLGEEMLDEIEYSVLSVKKNGDGVTARLKITAPDVSVMLDQVLEQMDTFEESAFISAMMNLLESDRYPVRDFEVDVDMQNLSGQWVVVSNPEFTNAMTGGLQEVYEANEKMLQDALKEEVE